MTLGLVQARKSSSPVLGAIPILRKQKDWVGGGRIFFADVQYYLCCRMVVGGWVGQKMPKMCRRIIGIVPCRNLDTYIYILRLG